MRCALVTLIATLLLPHSTVAQESGIEAVGRELEATGAELKDALERGELTEEQAWAEWYAARDEIIDGAVERGEISIIEGGDLRHEVRRSELKSQLEMAGQRIKAAHASGEMTEDEAWAAWHETQRQLVDAAVEEGVISDEEAPYWRGEKQETSALDKRIEEAGDAIKQAAIDGEITGDEAWEEWYETKDALIDEAIDNGELSLEEAEAYHRELSKAELSERLNNAGAEIGRQVASGELTEDEGWQAWYDRKEELIDTAIELGEIDLETAAVFHREIAKAEYQQLVNRAVARGEMSRDAAFDAVEAFLTAQHTAPETADEALRAMHEERAAASDVEAVGRDNEWAAYTREFIARHQLNDRQQQQAWRAYQQLRRQYDATAERLSRYQRSDDPDRAAAAADREQVAHDRLFERLKEQLDRLLTRSQRTAEGD